jgi:hypothetical protein
MKLSYMLSQKVIISSDHLTDNSTVDEQDKQSDALSLVEMSNHSRITVQVTDKSWLTQEVNYLTLTKNLL